MVNVRGYGVLTRKQAFESAIRKAKEILTSLETTGDITTGQIDLLKAFYEASKSSEWLTENTLHHRGASVFFTDGKNLLLLKRPSGKWDVPGGHSKSGETAFDTAKRESIEECGYFGGRKIATIDGTWPMFVMLVPKQFNCKLNSEHKEFKWTKLEGIRASDMISELAEALPGVLRKIETL
jgi:hypothetical protein